MAAEYTPTEMMDGSPDRTATIETRSSDTGTQRDRPRGRRREPPRVHRGFGIVRPAVVVRHPQRHRKVRRGRRDAVTGISHRCRCGARQYRRPAVPDHPNVRGGQTRTSSIATGGRSSGRSKTNWAGSDRTPATSGGSTNPYIELFDRNRKAQFRLLEEDTPENRAKAYCHYHHGQGILAPDGVLRDADLHGGEFDELPHLPGLVQGFTKIRSDEGRHVGFGMNQLKKLIAEGVGPAIVEGTVEELSRSSRGSPRTSGSSRTTRGTRRPRGRSRLRGRQTHRSDATDHGRRGRYPGRRRVSATRGRRLTEQAAADETRRRLTRRGGG